MEKYDFIKCMNLHKKLKDRIRGSIFISIDHDRMSININGSRGIKYRSFINDIPKYMDVDKYADSIEEDYKQFIYEKFFI